MEASKEDHNHHDNRLILRIPLWLLDEDGCLLALLTLHELLIQESSYVFGKKWHLVANVSCASLSQFHETFLWRKEDTLTCCVFLRNLIIYSITVPHMYQSKLQVHSSIFCELLIADMFSFLLMLRSNTSSHISFNIWNCYSVTLGRILLSIPDLWIIFKLFLWR